VAYFVGNGRDTAALRSFNNSIERTNTSLGSRSAGLESAVERLWCYGHGEAAIPYDTIRGDVSTQAAYSNPAAHRVAQKLAQREFDPITPSSRSLRE